MGKSEPRFVKLFLRRKTRSLSGSAEVDELISLVKTYRVSKGLAEKLELAERIIPIIGPNLQLSVLHSVPHQVAQDVFQEVLIAVALYLGKFQGYTKDEFWGWCYQIARNKLKDQYRKQARDHLQPVPDEVLWELVDASGKVEPISAGDRIDLEHGMQLLSASKPECYEMLWKRFVLGFDYDEIAEEKHLQYDAARMKINRCLDEARSLVA